MGLWPNIGPLDSTFPLFRPARLRVSARGRIVLDAKSTRILSIEVTNVTQELVEVVGVYAGYMYMNVLAEMTFGKSTPEFLLREFEGEPPPPRIIGAGEVVTWSAKLDQFEEQIEEEQLRLEPHSRYLDASDIDLEKWARRSRAVIAVRNAVAKWSQRYLAVAVRDEQGNLYKAKVRWHPPEELPPHADTRT